MMDFSLKFNSIVRNTQREKNLLNTQTVTNYFFIAHVSIACLTISNRCFTKILPSAEISQHD